MPVFVLFLSTKIRCLICRKCLMKKRSTKPNTKTGNVPIQHNKGEPMQYHTSQQAQTTTYIIHPPARPPEDTVDDDEQRMLVTKRSAKVQDSGPDARYVWNKASVPFRVLHVHTAVSKCICFGFRFSARDGL